MPLQTELKNLTHEQVDALADVLNLVRRRRALTRPELVRESGLGRSIVAHRVEQALDLGLLAEGDFGPSTGGRSPRNLTFVADHAHILVVVFGASTLRACVTDLEGSILASSTEPWEVAVGPEPSMARSIEVLKALMAEAKTIAVWGVTVGVPGPVEFGSGKPVSPPMMPGWHEYDIRARLGAHFQAAVWADNDVNLMARGQLASLGDGSLDLLFVKVGTGIGAGLVADGNVYRGSTGGAGDVGHIIVSDDPSAVCRCGKTGCLEAVAGGAALARKGTAEAQAGASPYLTATLQAHGEVHWIDVIHGARNGDQTCLRLIGESGKIVGENVASMINFFNPSVVTIGGGIAGSVDIFMAAVRETVYARSLPLATRNLRIEASASGSDISLTGGALLAIDQLFRDDNLRLWIGEGSPERSRLHLYTPAMKR